MGTNNYLSKLNVSRILQLYARVVQISRAKLLASHAFLLSLPTAHCVESVQ